MIRDTAEAVTLVTGVVAAQKQVALTGSYLLSSMVVFTDPSYLIIGFIGAFVSAMSHHYDVTNEKIACGLAGIPFTKTTTMEIVKALLIGLLFTMTCFMFLSDAGNAAIKHFSGINVGVVQLLPSFYMVLTLYLSTKSVTLYDRFSKRAKG